MLFRTAVRPEHRILPAAVRVARICAAVHTACRRAVRPISCSAEALVGVLQAEVRVIVAVRPAPRRRRYHGTLRHF